MLYHAHVTHPNASTCLQRPNARTLQSDCSFRVTRCSGAMDPANHLSPVGSNTQAHLVILADVLQCRNPHHALELPPACTTAALQLCPLQRQSQYSTSSRCRSARYHSPVQQPADTVQPLERNPSQLLLHPVDANCRKTTARTCCPHLRSRAPTQAKTIQTSTPHL